MGLSCAVGAVILWLPAVAWAGLIFALSAQSDLQFSPDITLDFVVRKVGHAAVYGILAHLIWRAVATTSSRQTPWAWALGLTILYAVSDELHQGFVVGRNASPVDVGTDGLGAVTTIVGARLFNARLGRARSGA